MKKNTQKNAEGTKNNKQERGNCGGFSWGQGFKFMFQVVGGFFVIILGHRHDFIKGWSFKMSLCVASLGYTASQSFNPPPMC